MKDIELKFSEHNDNKIESDIDLPQFNDFLGFDTSRLSKTEKQELAIELKNQLKDFII